MYILDYGNLRIQKWLPGMTYGVTVVSAAMNGPFGMQFDYSNNIVVADTSNHRIISFDNICRKYSVIFITENFYSFSSCNNYGYSSISKYVYVEIF
jgi:hypothetical protein